MNVSDCKLARVNARAQAHGPLRAPVVANELIFVGVSSSENGDEQEELHAGSAAEHCGRSISEVPVDD